MRKRNRSIYIRMTDEEYDLLHERVHSSGHTLQSYMINASLHGRISSENEVAELRKRNMLLEDMDKQLRGMGVNLNQMAHVANGQGLVPTAKELSVISSEIAQIKKEVNDTWQSTRQSISQQNLTAQ